MKYDPDRHGVVAIPDLLSEQRRDAVRLVEHASADFSEPGAGKTLTALAASSVVSERLLIVCPPSAVRMWLRTTAAFFENEDVWFLDAKLPTHMPRAVVTTYNRVLQLGVRTFVDVYNCDCAILDEAHKLKSLDAKRTRIIYGRYSRMGVDALLCRTKYAWALTGTPVVRHNDDLYPHLRALAPSVLAKHGLLTEDAFLRRYTHREMRQHHARMRPKLTVVGDRNTAELTELVYGGEKPFAVRRLVTDLTAMPPITFNTIDVAYEVTPELKEATERMHSPEMFEDEQSPALATVRRLLGVAKVGSVSAYAVELFEDAKRPVLILYWHKEVGEALLHRLVQQGYRAARLGGDTPASRKSELEDQFNAGQLDFLIGQIASMGESLNLQAGGNTALFAEPDWSPSAIEQAFRRLWRYGQNQHVRVLLCYADHPADAGAERVLQRKASNIDLLSPSATAQARRMLRT